MMSGSSGRFNIDRFEDRHLFDKYWRICIFLHACCDIYLILHRFDLVTLVCKVMPAMFSIDTIRGPLPVGKR